VPNRVGATITGMASVGERKGAGRPKGSKNKERTAIEIVTEKQHRQIKAGVEIVQGGARGMCPTPMPYMG